MKFYFALIGFIVILNCAGIGYLYITHENLEKRVKNIEFITENRTVESFMSPLHPPFKYDNGIFQLDSLRRVIDLKEVKQQYYLTQMNIQSDWFIFFVTVLFGIFSLVGYGFFVAHTKTLSKQYKKQKNIQEKHIEEVEKRFKVSEANTLRVLAKSINFQRNYCAEKGYYRNALKTQTDFINIILRIKELDEDMSEFNGNALMSLKNSLSYINKMYDQIDTNHPDFTFFFTSREAKEYKSYFDNLYSKVNDLSKDKIDEIRLKLEQGIERGSKIKEKYNADQKIDED